jgi:hypothetical protein
LPEAAVSTFFRRGEPPALLLGLYDVIGTVTANVQRVTVTVIMWWLANAAMALVKLLAVRAKVPEGGLGNANHVAVPVRASAGVTRVRSASVVRPAVALALIRIA